MTNMLLAFRVRLEPLHLGLDFTNATNAIQAHMLRKIDLLGAPNARLVHK